MLPFFAACRSVHASTMWNSTSDTCVSFVSQHFTPPNKNINLAIDTVHVRSHSVLLECSFQFSHNSDGSSVSYIIFLASISSV